MENKKESTRGQTPKDPKKHLDYNEVDLLTRQSSRMETRAKEEG